MPAAEFLFNCAAEIKSEQVAPWLSDDLGVDGKTFGAGGTAHGGGRCSGYVPGHGVTEAFEVAGFNRLAVFERGLCVNRTEDGVVPLKKLAEISAIGVPASPVRGQFDGRALVGSHSAQEAVDGEGMKAKFARVKDLIADAEATIGA